MQCLGWSVWTPSFLPIHRATSIKLFHALLLQSGSWYPWVQGFLFIGMWQYCD